MRDTAGVAWQLWLGHSRGGSRGKDTAGAVVNREHSRNFCFVVPEGKQVMKRNRKGN